MSLKMSFKKAPGKPGKTVHGAILSPYLSLNMLTEQTHGKLKEASAPIAVIREIVLCGKNKNKVKLVWLPEGKENDH